MATERVRRSVDRLLGEAEESLAHDLGAAAALAGNDQVAHGYYEQALEVAAKIGFRPEIGLTRLQLAELLLAESAKPDPLDLRSSPAVGARGHRALVGRARRPRP